MSLTGKAQIGGAGAGEGVGDGNVPSVLTGATYPPKLSPWAVNTKGYIKTSKLAELAVELGRLNLQMKSSPSTLRSLSVLCLNCQVLGAAGTITGNLEGKTLRTNGPSSCQGLAPIFPD